MDTTKRSNPPKRDTDQAAWDLRDKYTEKFWLRVRKLGNKPDDCWLWESRDSKGYGIFFFSGKTIKAHRYAQIITSGVPAPNMYTRHSCRRRHCVRPSHLSWGTNAENCADRVREKTTYCPAGELSHRAKISTQTATEIWMYYALTGSTTKQIAEKCGVSLSVVRNMLTGLSWKAFVRDIEKRWPRPDRRKNSASAREQKRCVLNEEKVKEIHRYAQHGCGETEAAERLGLPKYVVGNVMRGMSWANVKAPDFKLDPKYKSMKRGRLSRHVAEQLRAALQKGATIGQLVDWFNISDKAARRFAAGETHQGVW